MHPFRPTARQASGDRSHPPVPSTQVPALACAELRGILPLMASPNNIAQLPRIKPGRRGAVSQILKMQDVLAKDALDPETTPSARAQVARAWEVLEERKRILRMKPKPKDIDVTPKASLSKCPLSGNRLAQASFTKAPDAGRARGRRVATG